MCWKPWGSWLDLGPAGVARCIDEVGMGFCFAPRFHPAMRFAAPIRRELGIPTVFNYLGPCQPGPGPVSGGGGERPIDGRQDDRCAGGQRCRAGHDRLRRRRSRRATTTTTSTVLELRDGEVTSRTPSTQPSSAWPESPSTSFVAAMANITQVGPTGARRWRGPTPRHRRAQRGSRSTRGGSGGEWPAAIARAQLAIDSRAGRSGLKAFVTSSNR